MQPQYKSAMSQAQILDNQGTAHISKGEYFLALLTLSAAVPPGTLTWPPPTITGARP